MVTVHRYVLETASTNMATVSNMAKVLEILETALDSVYDLKRLPDVLRRMLGGRVGISLTTRKTIYIVSIGRFVIKAKFQGIRSLQDLAAIQVARSIRNNLVSLEQLPITNVTKKVVTKFIETA
eukprot:GFUD01025533.1.p1 GENE.GFUD01025533.1~~GFUD01025533.1.p1  ORF type:complete len:124 (-),score=17.37 GFUD01025533.1:145-516(-)